MSTQGRGSLWVAIAAGGAAGAYLRLGIATALQVAPGHWPWATFLANLAGTALLALVTTRLLEGMPPSRLLRPFWGTGMCGALTTFSAVQVEVLTLARDGHVALGAVYYAASVALGLLIAWLCTAAVRHPRIRLA